MPTLRAKTADPLECLSVMDWCFDVAKLGPDLSASCEQEMAELRVSLPPADPRLTRLVEKLFESGRWDIEIHVYPVPAASRN